MAAVMSNYAAPETHRGWIGSWSPGIGDPSIAGWLTVVAYFAAAYLCLVVGRRREIKRGSEAPFWTVLALGLAALGVNKQLDLQSAVTEFGRWLAKRQGLYGQHRELQRWFIGWVLVIALAVGAALTWKIRKSPRATKIAGLGVCALLTFIVVRAASFHNFDHSLGVRILGLKLNWLLELGGIGVVLYGAWKRLQTLGKTRRT
jgi:hypothetical protein